jgi:hypothetical protein
VIILSHRGLWRTPAEKNRESAFRTTLQAGFGTETDFRDAGGRLVISHDPAGTDALPAEQVVAMFGGRGLPLAVNIKADGLSELVAEAFAGLDLDWFAFDMSGPETVRYSRAGLPFFTRHSDVERIPIMYEQASGVWLDAFGSAWYGPDVVEQHLDAGKRVCVVSAELHGRDPTSQWRMLAPLAHRPGLMLCTDHPDQATRIAHP